MIAVIGTLDTKGDKVAYLKQLIEGKGEETLTIDSGVLGSPSFQADIPREEVAEAAGESLDKISSLGNEARAMSIMAEGTSKIVAELYSSGKLGGVIGVGGTMGTSLFLSATKVLPVGVPKVLFSTIGLNVTMASKVSLPPEMVPLDLIMVPAVSDIWGLNSLTKRMLENAAGTIIGTAQMYKESEKLAGKTFVAISTLGTSALKYIQWLKPCLEGIGHEVAAFHSGGGQGQALEQLVRQGIIKGILDLCLLEVADAVCGGILSGEGKLEAASKRGIPQIIAPGAIDFFSWGPPDTLPERFKGRKRRQHNELTWQIETSLEEVAKIAELIGRKLNKGHGPRIVVIPKLGFSEFDKPGCAFYNPERSRVFRRTLKGRLKPEIRVIESEAHINDRAFAEEVAKSFIPLMGHSERQN